MVELPLALPVILAGVRIAAVTSVGTATIAAAIGAGGLGTYVFRGIATVDTRLILAGAIPSALLALLVDGVLARGWSTAVAPGRAGALASLVTALRSRSPFRRPPARGPACSRGRIQELHRASRTRGAGRGSARAARNSGRPAAQSRGHRALPPGGEGGPARRLRGVHRNRAHRSVEAAGPIRSGRGAAHRKRGYRPLGLVVGEPLGFNNSFALVVRRDDAEAQGLRRISDIAPHAASIRVGLFGEFLEREDGLRGLLRAYGFRFAIAPREMDLGLLYRARATGRSIWSWAAPPTA